MDEEPLSEIALYDLIVAHYNDAELRELCFRLRVNYEDLSGGGRADKIRELVVHCQRHDLLTDLHDLVKHRPQPPIPSPETIANEILVEALLQKLVSERQRQEEEVRRSSEQLLQEDKLRKQQQAQELAANLRASLIETNKLKVQHYWQQATPDILREMPDYEWLEVLVQHSLGERNLIDFPKREELVNVWPSEVAGAIVCCPPDGIAIYRIIPLDKVADPQLRNHLIRLSRDNLPLQDWPPDWTFPADLDGFRYRAEDELTSLFKHGAFWEKHPVYRMVAMATQNQVVYGQAGCGRTAVARGLCCYESQLQHMYWAYIPLFTAQSTIEELVRQTLADQLLQYVLSKPTRLYFLQEAERKLLGRVLGQALSAELLHAKIEQAIKVGEWYRLATPKQKKDWREVGETQLQLLMQNIQEKQPLTPQRWRDAVQSCFQMLGFHNMRLIFDVMPSPLDVEGQPHLFAEMTSWQQLGVLSTAFMPDSMHKTMADWQLGMGQQIPFTWSKEQLDALIFHRFARLNQTPPWILLGNDYEPLLQQVDTPTQFILFWRKVLMPDGVEQEQPSVLQQYVQKSDPNRSEQQHTLYSIEQRVLIVKNIETYFNLDEMKSLCMSLNIEFENLPGDLTRNAKARELVDQINRHGRLADLLTLLRQERPFVEW